MIEVEVLDAEARAQFARLREAVSELRPLMQALGEHLVETTKQRFETSTGPDGKPWAPNAESTYVQFADKSKGSLHKNGPHKGRVTTVGTARLAGKKPLIGDTRALSTRINYRAGSDFVEIGSPERYAAVQQFRAKKHSFSGGRTPWADIPPRPFIGLSSADRAWMLDQIVRAIAQAADGRCPTAHRGRSAAPPSENLSHSQTRQAPAQSPASKVAASSPARSSSGSNSTRTRPPLRSA